MGETRSKRSDRREFKRAVIGMPVQAVLHDALSEDSRRVMGLHVLNVSRGGARVASQQALTPTQPLTLFFPPIGPGKGRDTRGQVVRCDDLGDRYAVGIAFEEPWPESDEVFSDCR